MSEKTFDNYEQRRIGAKGMAVFMARHPGLITDKSDTFEIDFIIDSTGDSGELKTDTQGHRTMNLFVELETFGSPNIQSGVYQAIKHKCKHIVYQTDDGKEFWFDPTDLKNITELWRRTHGGRYVQVESLSTRPGGGVYRVGGMKMPILSLAEIQQPSPFTGRRD